MKKNIIKTFKIGAVIAFLGAPQSNIYAHTVIIHKKYFRDTAGHMMHEHDRKSRYWVALHDVNAYLPEEHKIKRKSVKLINDRIVPGKTMLKTMRHFMYYNKDIWCEETIKNIFTSLSENKPHTYVVTYDKLIFTESTNFPSEEIIKDKFTKHFLISGLLKKVNYSGEFHVYKNPENNQVFVVFDNSSGTYQPPSESLPYLQQLLEDNLNSSNDSEKDKIYIITKNFKQQIDKEKLFNHDPEPFSQLEAAFR